MMTLDGEARSLDVVTDPDPVSDSTVSSISPFFTAGFRFRFRPFSTGADRIHIVTGSTIFTADGWAASLVNVMTGC